MSDRNEGVGTVARVLDAAESASPVEAVEAVTHELGLALGASSVSFLIADLSGRALVRLAHVVLGDSGDDGPSATRTRRASIVRRVGHRPSL